VPQKTQPFAKQQASFSNLSAYRKNTSSVFWAICPLGSDNFNFLTFRYAEILKD
jgi:hypothetical protein